MDQEEREREIERERERKREREREREREMFILCKRIYKDIYNAARRMLGRS